MNVIFSVCLALSFLACLLSSPESALTALEKGGSAAVNLSVKLAAIYVVWLGFFRVMEDAGLTRRVSRALSRPAKLLFGKTGSAETDIATCLAANLLGIGAVATKSGISAMQKLDEDKNEFAKCMLFVVSATSIQILPVSVVTLRASFGSASPSDIILPSLIATAFSTLLGVILTKIFVKK